jgi:hypothetical protein
MRRIHPLMWLLIFACIATLGICTLFFGNQSSGHAQTSSLDAAQTLPPASAGPGMPAITSGSKNSTGATYTSADAARFVSTHRVFRTFGSSTKPIVDTARFLRSQEVSQLFNGESLGVPDGTLVCEVVFHGTFLVPGPTGKTGTFQNGAEVFDAQTGNLLLVRLWP